MAAANSDTQSAGKCPVDHKARETWLAEAKAASAATEPVAVPGRPSSLSSNPTNLQAQNTPQSASWSWQRAFLPWPLMTSSRSDAATTARPRVSPRDAESASPSLSTARQVSSIPRSSNPGSSSCPVNHEVETGSDKESGNWIYPSEKMFFEAMRRKGNLGAAREEDMRTVVPMHNAVNERAWAEILEWERPYTGGTMGCDRPRLHSFAGLSTKMSPKARINTLLGYTAPFDRHDWTVDRCGTQVDYVIDFYAGRKEHNKDGAPTGKVSFYLDVRPKLNSLEGIKMRLIRGLGLV